GGGEGDRDEKRLGVVAEVRGDADGDGRHERGDGVVGEDLGEDRGEKIDDREEHEALGGTGGDVLDAGDDVEREPFGRAGGLHGAAHGEHAVDEEKDVPLDGG